MITIIFSILACAINAFMDAIDHGKGARTLKFVWHALKPLWYISVFFAGMSLICFELNLNLFDVVFSILKNYYKYIGMTLAALWLMWESIYNLLRWIFKYTGIPEWF